MTCIDIDKNEYKGCKELWDASISKITSSSKARCSGVESVINLKKLGSDRV